MLLKNLLPTGKLSLHTIAELPPKEREAVAAVLSGLTNSDQDELSHDWEFYARPEQLEPEGDYWTTWVYMAGRGAGKTRTGAEWIRECVKRGARRLGIVGPTAGDARDVMIEGPSGILAVCWEGDEDVFGRRMGAPDYQPSKRRIVWANGAMCGVFSAEEPDRLRGPQHERVWADELAAWQYPEDTWDMAMFGLRVPGLLGDPRVMVTTTPRPIRLVRLFTKDPTVVFSRGKTIDNAANLAPAFLSQITKKYEGTRLGRQELGGELLDDVPGALWTHAMIDKNRIAKEAMPDLQRICVAVDPSGASGDADEQNNAIGIVACGLGVDGRGYVLRDETCLLSPRLWGLRCVALYQDTGFGPAEILVAEANFGGAMVEHVIRSVDRRVNYKPVTASRGKAVRAEPISAITEQGRLKFVGSFPELEDELCQFTPEGYVGAESPNRADALVWAIHELMLGEGSYTLAHVL